MVSLFAHRGLLDYGDTLTDISAALPSVKVAVRARQGWADSVAANTPNEMMLPASAWSCDLAGSSCFAGIDVQVGLCPTQAI